MEAFAPTDMPPGPAHAHGASSLDSAFGTLHGPSEMLEALLSSVREDPGVSWEYNVAGSGIIRVEAYLVDSEWEDDWDFGERLWPAVDLYPERHFAESHPELRALVDFPPDLNSDPVMPPAGSFGRVAIRIALDDEDTPTLLFLEIHPSRGLRQIKDEKAIYREWNKAVIRKLMFLSIKVGVSNFYASTRSRIVDMHDLVPEELMGCLNQGNLRENYVIPFRDDWKKLDTGRDKGKFWRYVGV